MTVRSEQKARTHADILASASRLLRERGIAGANVADVMRGVGLTVGGFYAHFASKEQLVGQALRNTLREHRARILAGVEDADAVTRLGTILERYLSKKHRDDVENGCALPAVTSEIATNERAYAPALAEEISSWIDRPHTFTAEGLAAREVILAVVALMVGGLSLARALNGTPLSDDVLRASRRFGRAAIRALVTERPKGEKQP